MLTARLLVLSAVFFSFIALGCGKNQPEAERPPAPEIDNEDEFDEGMGMMQEFGGMNEEKVTRAFKRVYPQLSECLKEAWAKQPQLFGDVAFLVTVNLDGVAEQAQAEKSTLGNFEAERCMLAILKDSIWPKPVGGLLGHARWSIGFDPAPGQRPAEPWAAEDIAGTLSGERNSQSLSECGSGGPFEITAYVETSGSVSSVGVAHVDNDGEETARCLADSVAAMKFPSPGSWRSKVTFSR